MTIFPQRYLYTKKSSLPSSGKGLFTKRLIPKGTLIVEYKGKITNWKDVDHDNNGYVYYVKRYHVIDGRFDKTGFAKYANDAKGLSKVKGISNNSEYVELGLRVFIQAEKDILPGDEILVAYGKEYWDVIRYNLRIDARNK
jgi:SET domain-containing protein